MANEAIKLYQFYRRYKWTENDFDGWQQGMVDQGRGMFEGLFGGAVLEGFAPSLTGGLNIDVSAGIASGPTGFLNVVNSVSALSFTAPSADYERALVVVRPDLTNADYMTKPTDPNVTVPLTMEQRSVVEILRGVPAVSPEYPATEANDVVLFGVRLEAGQVTIAEVDLDFEVRDLPGKNSNFQQDAAKYDDRLRPYRSTNQVVGVKPSQLAGPFGRVFSYVNKKYPSIYPQDSSNNYNHADTYFNMTTGAITGGDEITANFIPTIPTAGNAIVATVAIDTNDEAVVTYGTAGTRADCFTGIKDQNIASAGSINIQDNTKPIAFVICYSDDGSSITEIDVIDCRGGAVTGYPISPANITKAIARYTTNAGQSIPNITYTVVDFEDKVFDTKNNVTTGASWKFTASEAGYYRVSASIYYDKGGWDPTQYATLGIRVNGSDYSYRNVPTVATHSDYVPVHIDDVVYLNAGQYVDIVTRQSSGGALTLYANGSYNYVSIEQIM